MRTFSAPVRNAISAGNRLAMPDLSSPEVVTGSARCCIVSKVRSKEPWTKIQFIAQVPRAFADGVCGHSSYDGIGRHITGHNSAGRHYCPLSDGDPWHDNGAVANPH